MKLRLWLARILVGKQYKISRYGDRVPATDFHISTGNSYLIDPSISFTWTEDAHAA